MIRTRTKQSGPFEGKLPKAIAYAAEPIFQPPIVTLEDDGERLAWRARRRRPQQLAIFPRVKPEPDLIRRFVRLGLPDVQGEEICNFASTWGVLELCPHDLPGGRHILQETEEVRIKHCGHWALLEGSESLRAWRQIARRFGATLRIVTELHRGRLGRAEDWRTLLPKPDATLLRHESLQRRAIVDEVARLELLADVRLRLHWPSGRQPKLLQGGNGLFGALVVQLKQAICLGEGSFTCKSCGCFDFRRKRKGTRLHKYCRDCGLSGTWRTNKREQRKRDRLVLDLHAEGRSNPEIALRLAETKGITRARFVEEPDRWIKKVERVIARGVC